MGLIFSDIRELNLRFIATIQWLANSVTGLGFNPLVSIIDTLAFYFVPDSSFSMPDLSDIPSLKHFNGAL